MIITTRYKVALEGGEIQEFYTQLTEREFLNTLKAVYGDRFLVILEIEKIYD